jgi:hypothetical protein
MFVEQSIPLGLTPQSVCQPLMPAQSQAVKRFKFQDLATTFSTNEIEDIRPFLLWNTLLLLISSTPGRYDSRSRAFLRLLACDFLEYGTFVDVIEEIEAPIAEIPLLASDDESFLETAASLSDPNEPAAAVDKKGAQMHLRHGLSASQLPRSQSAISTLSSSTGVRPQSGGSSSSTVPSDLVVPESTNRLLKNMDTTQRTTREKRMRMLKMAAATVGGGAILGVSAGLAAPILGKIFLCLIHYINYFN